MNEQGNESKQGTKVNERMQVFDMIKQVNFASGLGKDKGIFQE